MQGDGMELRDAQLISKNCSATARGQSAPDPSWYSVLADVLALGRSLGPALGSADLLASTPQLSHPFGFYTGLPPFLSISSRAFTQSR